MKKRLSVLSLALALCVLFTACGSNDPASNGGGDPATPYVTGVTITEPSKTYDDDTLAYVGEFGDKFSTAFFDFIVHSAARVDAYDGYTAPSGYALVDAYITIENDTASEQPMFNSDFILIWDNDDYGYGSEDTYELADVMPDSYPLEAGASVTYHVVFEVPENTTTYEITYLEMFASGRTGNTYSVYFDK